MSQSALKESASLLQAIAAALITSTPNANAGGPALRQACGWLSANAVTAIRNWQIGTPLLTCFQAATGAGATVGSFALVRAVITGTVTVSPLAGLVAQAAICMSLAEEVRAISQYAFTSRDDVESTIGAMNAAFDPAIDFAAVADDATAYRSLVALRAAMARDLSVRGWPLPSMTNFAFSKGRSMLALANRLYGDASRVDELTLENKVVHPLFGPSSGRALSS